MPDREDTKYATSNCSGKLMVALNFFLEASFFKMSFLHKTFNKKNTESDGGRLLRYGHHGST